MGCIEGQMTHLDEVDTKELGEAIDMIKDLEEAMYYCTITKAMEQKEQEQQYYTPTMYYPEGNSNGKGSMSPGNGVRGSGHSSNGNTSYYTEREMPMDLYDYRQGRSPKSRRSYMEAKETHQDKTHQMKELEKYVQELAQDMVEMIEGSSPEEKQYLSKKVSALATKIAQSND